MCMLCYVYRIIDNSSPNLDTEGASGFAIIKKTPRLALFEVRDLD